MLSEQQTFKPTQQERYYAARRNSQPANYTYLHLTDQSKVSHVDRPKRTTMQFGRPAILSAILASGRESGRD